MLEAILKALENATAQDVMGYAGVWLISPLVAFLWVNMAKRERKSRGEPLTRWQMRMMASLTSGLMALFVAKRMAGWPLDKALNHAVAVGVAFPLLITIILDKIQRVAPDIADDIGDLPTEFRAADTTELGPVCTSDRKDAP